MTENTNKTSGADVAFSLTRGVVGTIPVIGSLASEIFGLVVTPPLEKRRLEWMSEISGKLKEVEEKKGVNLLELQDNNLFIDVVLQATTFALKTSEKEKVNGFKNAVLNTAIGVSIDKTKCQIFLNQLDKFTTWHILILDFIDSPNSWFNKKNITPDVILTGSLHSLITKAFPELKGQLELLNIIWSDLKSTGFHDSADLKTMMNGKSLFNERTTKLGKEFISFISNYEQ